MVRQFPSIRFWDKIFLIIAGVLFIAYFVIVYKFTINIPYTDDFYAFNDFLAKYTESDSWLEKFKLLFRQHYIHRVLLTRLVSLAVYFLTGKINYSAYIFIGHILFAGTGVLLYKIIKIEKLKALSVLMIISLLFNGQNFETSTWALALLGNVGTLFLAFLSMYLLLSEDRKSFFTGLFFAVITIFSNGNGMFIVPVILCCFIIQKRIRDLTLFSCIAGVCIVIFFYNFTNNERISQNIPELLSRLDVLAANFFIFIGNNLWLPSAKFISLIAGVICFAIYVWGLIKGAYKKDLFCFSCLTFLYITAAAATYGSESEIGLAFHRYRIYGSLILILTCLLIVNHSKIYYAKRFIYLLPVFALSLSLFSTVFYQQKTQQIWEWKMKSAYNWEHHIERLAAFSSMEEVAGILRKTEQLSLYTMPVIPLSEYKSKIKKFYNFEVNAEPDIIYQIEKIEEQADFLVIEGYAFLKNHSMNQTSLALYFVDAKNKFECIPFFERRYDITNDINKVECGFFLVINKNEITKGNYAIGIGIKRVFGKSFQILTGSQVTI